MDSAELQIFRNTTVIVPALISGLHRQQGVSGETTQSLQALGREVDTAREELKQLTEMVRQQTGSQLRSRHPEPRSVSSTSPGSGYDGIRLPHPERYNGDMGECRFFLTQCSIAFQLQPEFYPNDRAKVAYIISLLTGKALAWATPVWNQDVHFCSVLDEFVEEMKKIIKSTKQLVNTYTILTLIEI